LFRFITIHSRLTDGQTDRCFAHG